MADDGDKRDDAPRDDDGFAEKLVKIGGALGFNEVKLRWKLRRWSNSAQRFKRRAEQRATHVGYQHKTCAECGAVQDKDAKVCTSCGSKLSSRQWQMLKRIGLTAPEFLSLSTLIGACMAICYVMEIAANGGGGLMSMSTAVVIEHGANYAPMTRGGDYWRLGTAMFLHSGLWHLGFNLFALSIVGPHVEDMYGRPFSAFLYLVTGIAASAASLFVTAGLSVGASGAVMGLIGVAAAAGHMDGTSSGRAVRDTMLKWLVYTTIFGLFMTNMDHAAHFGGFIAGAVLGAAIKPRAVFRQRSKPWASALGGASILALAALTFITLFPPNSAYLENLTADFERDMPAIIEACAARPDLATGDTLCAQLERIRVQCPHGAEASLDADMNPEYRAFWVAACRTMNPSTD